MDDFANYKFALLLSMYFLFKILKLIRALTVFKTFIMVLSSVLVYARKLLGIPSNPIKNTEEVDIQ